MSGHFHQALHNQAFTTSGMVVPDPEPKPIAKAKRILRKSYSQVYCLGLVDTREYSLGGTSGIGNRAKPAGTRNQYRVGDQVVDRKTLLEMARERRG